MHSLPEPVRRTLLTAVVAGPVVVSTGTLVGTLRGSVFSDTWQGGINVLGTGIWLLGVVALTLAVAEHAPRLGAALLGLGVVCLTTGAAWGADYMVGAVHGERLAADVGAPFLFVMIPGALFPLVLAATGVALWRVGAVPAAAGLTLAVGALLFPAGRIPEIGAVALTGDIVLLTGSVLCARALARRPSGTPTS